MSVTEGRNPPIDKRGEIVGGEGNAIIRFHIRLLSAFADIGWRPVPEGVDWNSDRIELAQANSAAAAATDDRFEANRPAGLGR
jgi:hypothetical protein